MARMSSVFPAAVMLGAMTGAPTAALADPVTNADLAGKKICWSDGGKPTYGQNGVYDESGFGHGTWKLAGDQITVVVKYGEYTGTITKENDQFHLKGKINGNDLDTWGKYCN
jgi:hypothetical protein